MLESLRQLPSLSAGITHFCTGNMRSWGRDSMISLRGLAVSTGRHEYAHSVLVATAAMLWNGLLPNLLDSGHSPRYNCRDSCWWFLQALQEYCHIVPGGIKILQEKVPRLFVDEEPPVSQDKLVQNMQKRSMLTVIIDILEHHLNGVSYREHNAGFGLDRDMHDQGFNVSISVNATTGFIQGGHRLNCGTWMDKNGSSTACGNAGIPATPRDGSPIELVALQASALRWLAKLQDDGVIDHHVLVRLKSKAASAFSASFPLKLLESEHSPKGSSSRLTRGPSTDRLRALSIVETDDWTKGVTFADWYSLIQRSFERYFWIPEDGAQDGSYDIGSSRPWVRGIYKDCLGCQDDWFMFQLRPNQAIAMAVAPFLFDTDHARVALKTCRERLLSKMGMRTLDSGDMAYRPNYDSAEDGTHKSTAKGWNYHQGPEWLWPTGYFLRAYALLHEGSQFAASRLFILQRLACLTSEMLQSPWFGLPELQNLNGSYCRDSCSSQAWSMSAFLDAWDSVCL